MQLFHQSKIVPRKKVYLKSSKVPKFDNPKEHIDSENILYSVQLFDFIRYNMHAVRYTNLVYSSLDVYTWMHPSDQHQTNYWHLPSTQQPPSRPSPVNSLTPRTGLCPDLCTPLLVLLVLDLHINRIIKYVSF